MKHRLLVDVGNTRIKWAIEVGQTLTGQGRFSWRSEGIQQGLQTYWSVISKPREVHISNVAGELMASEINDWCTQHWDIEPTYAKVGNEHSGLKNSYPEPQTLGVDRWLAMIAGWQPRKNHVCIIDAGSAVTIDLVTADGTHQGGLIAPGLNLLGRALTDHTHALALAELSDFSLLTDNTGDGISSGCYHWFIGGVGHVIEKIRREYLEKSNQQIDYIVTGGDAEQLQSALGVNLIHEPDLVLQGLMLDSK